MDLKNQEIRIGVVGLGYVGLPVALEFSRKYPVIGFDINHKRIEQLKLSNDISGELPSNTFKGCNIQFTSSEEDLISCNVYVVAVPTPIDNEKAPDLNPLISATKTISRLLTKNNYVVYESTVYPGCTEEICIPILENESGLEYKTDFKVGYSPERINPGDKNHTLTKIVKVVSGCDDPALQFFAQLYGSIIDAGIHMAPSIKVAEAAKIIENTQRDVNIALMNELAVIFDKMEINTPDVLAAANTKWNFLNFHPGLVGGHCIGVDPYYLTFKAKELGYEPQMILSGRKINDQLHEFIVDKILNSLKKKNKQIEGTKVLLKGITFKENVSDTRNSKVFDLINSLKSHKMFIDVLDPLVNPAEIQNQYGLKISTSPQGPYDVLIVAIMHNIFKNENIEDTVSYLTEDAVIFDIKSHYNADDFKPGIEYLNL